MISEDTLETSPTCNKVIMSALLEHQSYLLSIPSDLIVMDRIQSSLPLDEEMKLVKRFPADTCMLHVFQDPSRRVFAAYIGTHRVHTRPISRWFSTMEEALVQTFRIYTYRLYIRDRPQLWMEDYTDVILTMDMLFQIIPLTLLS